MIGVVGAGAFGTALAVALARDGRKVMLWARDPVLVAKMQDTGRNEVHLPGIALPASITAISDLAGLIGVQAVLLALPMQALGMFLNAKGHDLHAPWFVACCKGVDLATLQGPVALLHRIRPDQPAALLTGPSFAADIARGLPAALTLAGGSVDLQNLLSTAALRLYRSDDVTGAELGGAMKNVIAIASGIVIGAGLGDSARAALMSRGYAEMLRLALVLGARAETLAGLSGLGDLILTCTSVQSRNFRYGHALGTGAVFDSGMTVEGVATARAVAHLAQNLGIDMPITAMIAALIDCRITLTDAIQALLSRPLKQE